MPEYQISPQQLRAARAWLEISQEELARTAGVGRRAIADYERGARLPFDRTLAQVRQTLEGYGIKFLFENSKPVGLVDSRAQESRGDA